MTILCIETSTSVCSAAICKDGKSVRQSINYEGSNHARLLPLYVEELLAYAREQKMPVDAVALSEGPGSYTGLRIGTATAKGLCYGLSIPLIPVPTLEVLCEAAKEKLEKDNKQSSTVNYLLIPMIDARRMEVYTMLDGETKDVIVENEGSLLYNNNMKGGTSESEAVYYFGDGADKCTKVFTRPDWHYIPGIVPEAQYVGRLAEQNSTINYQPSNAHSNDLAYYEPFYLKEFMAAPSHVKGLR